MSNRSRLAVGALIAAVFATGWVALLHSVGPVAANDAQIAAFQDRVAPSKADAAEAVKLRLVPPQATSVLNVPHQLRYGEYVWDDKGVPPGKALVWVDLERQLVSVYRGGYEIGSAVILYGADGKETPLGAHPILAKFAQHTSRTYDDAPMPFTLRLTNDGVAIHGSTIRAGSATHGCVGVPLEFAEKLFHQVEVGDMVEIVRSAKPALTEKA